MEPTNQPKLRIHRRAWKWISLHRTRTIVVLAVVIVAVAATAAWFIVDGSPMVSTKAIKVPAKPRPIYYAPLTGEVVEQESDTTRPVTAIMIENSPDARPQSGLKQAEVVYEAVAEGGITRFLAVYQQQKPKLIGPVRSLRMYYVDWLAPYNASVAHVGGSYNALKVVRSGGYRDIDQFFNPNTYWRATDRYAPHNVYTSFSRIDALNKSKGYKTSKPKTFERKTEAKPAKPNAQTVNLSISGPLYNSSYTYDAKTKLYSRSQAGAPHMDREKGRITARVVVALMVNMKQVFEDGYRESITTNGPGIAYVFQNGRVTKVKWHKSGRSDQLHFSKDGEAFALERGTTWISAIPNGSGSVTWK